MKTRFIASLLAAACLALGSSAQGFLRVEGPNLVDSTTGEKFFIAGTNLGNWLNPEGYMFGLKRCNSARLIDEMLTQLVGPDASAAFWRDFKDNYITREDIDFIASTGANTVRLPFHYKLLTTEPYMGLQDPEEGYRRIDSVVGWCRDAGLRLILEMHDCPGGQTGDNIDDSYGYPWLMTSEDAQRQFRDIWRGIARRYADEPVILGYELMNEPIAHYFDDKDELNARLEPLYRQTVADIRAVDPRHIILLGGAQWNSNFEPLQSTDYEGGNVMWTCHRYGGPATADAIRSYIDHRDRTSLPMYMGELGHNTMEWQADFAEAMRANNIGYTYWPYKKLGDSCMAGIVEPEGWQGVVTFAESPRYTFEEIRTARAAVDPSACAAALRGFAEGCRLERCVPQTAYIESMRLKDNREKEINKKTK